MDTIQDKGVTCALKVTKLVNINSHDFVRAVKYNKIPHYIKQSSTRELLEKSSQDFLLHGCYYDIK